MNIKNVLFLFSGKNANCIHYGASSYFFILTFSVLIACNFFIYPMICKDYKTWMVNVLFLHFIFLNIIGNYFLGVKTSSFVSKDKILEDPPRSWRFCFKCNHHSPPRSHHCSVCNACVLKHDHHCFFFFQCVGLKNQKYFIMFTFYVAIGSVYAIKMLLQYLNITYVTLHLTFHSICSYFFPVLLYHWHFSKEINVTFTTVFCMIVMYGCFSTASGCSFLFITQCLLVSRGQTQYEFFENKKAPSANILQRITDVFGPLWILHCVFPLPFTAKKEKKWFPGYYKNV